MIANWDISADVIEGVPVVGGDGGTKLGGRRIVFRLLLGEFGEEASIET